LEYAGFYNTSGWVSAAPSTGTLNPLGTGHGTPVYSFYYIGPRAAKEDIYLYITTNEGSLMDLRSIPAEVHAFESHPSH